MHRALRWLRGNALAALALLISTPAVPLAQGVEVSFRNDAGGVIPQWSRFYESTQQFVIQVCSPNYITGITGYHQWSGGSTALVFVDGAYADCPGGGTAYYAEVVLRPDANFVSVEAYDSWSNGGFATLNVIHIPSNRASVRSPASGGLRMAPGSTQTLPVTITNTGSGAATFGVSVGCTGPFSDCKRVQGATTTFTTGSLQPGASEVHEVTVTAGSVQGSGFLVVTANSDYPDTESSPLFVSSAPVPPPEITRGRDTVFVATSAARSATFVVRNPDAFASRTISLSITSCGALTSCVVAPASLALGAGRDSVVAVTFNTPAASQTTAITLNASATGPSQSASATTAVKVGTAPAPVIAVNVADHNPGTTIARDQCLSIAAGQSAGVECGALRVVHSTPGVRTMGVARAPTLSFLSDNGYPTVRVQAHVTASHLTVTDSVRAILSVPGASGLQVTSTWPWSPECGTAAGCRITMVLYPWQHQMPTGVYDYTLQVQVGGGGSPPSGSATGSFVVIDDRASHFGQGWVLEGHERLQSIRPDTSQLLWIAGDASTRVYVKRSASVWTVQTPVSRPDTLLKVGTEWHRKLRNGGSVVFDALMRQVRTVNRQGHITRFVYRTATAARVDSIVLPLPPGSTSTKAFKFIYNADSSRVVELRAPGELAQTQRTTKLAYDANGHLTTVVDASGDTVRFLYYPYTSTAVITGRVNRLRDTTTYGWDGYGAVNYVSVSMRGAPAIYTTFCAAESRSLAGCSDGSGFRPLSPARVVTRFDGPRTDVLDITRFHVNRLGAPDTIVDALGGRIRLKRQHASLPALVTEVIDAAGLVSRTSYNARGLPDSVRVIQPFGGADAISTYQWHPKWDMVTLQSTPTGEVDSIRVDSVSGNRVWQQRGGAAGRVSFFYDSQNRLDSVVTAAIGRVARFQYESALGNLHKSFTAKGFVTEALQNGYGADTTIWTPTDSLQTTSLRTKQVVKYDVMGRPIRTETWAPAVSWSLSPLSSESGQVPASKQVAVTQYDKEGRTLSVTRFSDADSSFNASAASVMEYDAAGRLKQRHERHTSNWEVFTYDPAGNVVATQSRRGLTVRQSFDALNRVVARTTPQIVNPRVFCSDCHSYLYFIVGNDSVFAPEYGSKVAAYFDVRSLEIPAEMTVFGYDAAGRMVQADNPDVRIRRGYFPNGALRADTTTLRSYEPTGTESWPMTNRSILTYTYDLAGRRLSRADQRGGLQTYAYNAKGELAGTTDRAVAGGDTVGVQFTYDALGRLQTQSVPTAGVSAAWSYDVDGRVLTRVEEGFSDSFAYDARGKRVQVTGKLLMSDASAGGFLGHYDGLGQLIASVTNDRPVPTTDVLRLDAHGNTKSRWSNRLGWGGNTESLDSSAYVGHRLDSRLGSHFPEGRTGPGGVGAAVPTVDSLSVVYDLGGNVIHQAQIKRRWIGNINNGYSQRAPGGHSWTWNYYDASERLRYSQRSTTVDTTGKISGVFEEYWYDALGRRVLVRTRVDSATACPANEVESPARCQQQVLRTTWDGDQVLFEQRDPGGWQHLVYDAANRPGSASWYGHVRYTQTGAIDNPLVVWRNDATPRVLHRNWRGNVAGATFALNGQVDATTVWPAAVSDVWLAPDSRQTLPEPNLWLGSLVVDGKDGTGTLYRRNRYYDPATGRFTQEDPIGLAGGLNLYGYAGGDPVNFGDAFGLSGCPKDSSDPDCNETVQQAAMRAANEWFNKAAARTVSIAGALGNRVRSEGPAFVAEEAAMAFVPVVGQLVKGRRIARVLEGGVRFLSENRHLRSAAHAWEASGLTADEVLDAIDATSGWQTASSSIVRQRTIVKGIEIEFNVFRQSASSSEWIVNAWIK